VSELVHAFRPTIFSAERSFRLGPDALEWKDGRHDGRAVYADVSRVNLSVLPILGQEAQRRCALRSRPVGKIVLSSASYKALGVIEDRSASYIPFVRELTTRIAAANPQAIFIAGQPWGLWLFWLILLIASAVILLCGIILGVMGQFPPAATAVFGILALFLPLGWRIVRHDHPRPFDPKTLAAGDLPG
jgi:hypothetical protein